MPAQCNVGLELKSLKQLTLTVVIIIPGDGDSRVAWCQGCCLEACIDCSSSGCPLLHHTSTLHMLWTGVLVHCAGLVQGNIGMYKWGCVCLLFGVSNFLQRVLLNIVNFSKSKSLYRDGMTPVVMSSSRQKWYVWV